MDKLKEFFRKLNEAGIPVPLFRIDGKPSASFTLVVVSTFFVMMALLNSFAKLFKGIDTQSTLYWAGMCYSLYFGRKLTGDGKSLTIDAPSKEETKNGPKT